LLPAACESSPATPPMMQAVATISTTQILRGEFGDGDEAGDPLPAR
jgi:hypothetical protein